MPSAVEVRPLYGMQVAAARPEVLPVVRIPLPDLPSPLERSPSPELISVAGHELNHALAADSEGILVGGISVRPMGTSLGRTTLAGIVSYEKLKIVAAGGGVHTHEGCAEGYGSDKYKVDLLHHHLGGMSWEGAKAKAASAITRYSSDVRKRAAEIIAHLGEVSGSLLRDILVRAEFELNMERNMSNDTLLALYAKQPVVQKPQELYTYTQIEILPTGEMRIRYFVDGQEKKKEFLCPECGGINSHFAVCSTMPKKEENGIVIWEA